MAEEKTTTQEQGEQESAKQDKDKLPTPTEKYKNYEADRKRLAEEHGQT